MNVRTKENEETILLMNLLSQLRFPVESTGLALLYTHKFRHWQDQQASSTLDSSTLALATISLSAKASEKPRRLRELLVPAYNYLNPTAPKLVFPSALYDKLRASLVKAELLLLRILRFELRLATPYDYLDDLLRDFLDFSKTDSSHYEDYVKVTDSLLGLASKVMVNKALIDKQVALLYTAKTIATSSVILAAQSIAMEPRCASSPELLDQWIKDEAREDPVDIEDCCRSMKRQRS